MTEFSITTEALHALVEECREAADNSEGEEEHQAFNAALWLDIAIGHLETYQRLRRRKPQDILKAHDDFVEMLRAAE